MDTMLGISHETLAAFCLKHHIVRLSVFGSTLRGEARDDSDLDLLVEFDPAHSPGLLGLASMEMGLSAMTGRRVDLRTKGELSRYFRDEVVEKARVQYAQ
jgi:hypothetical protein